MASEAVFKFLAAHNRPFAPSQIQESVKGGFGKAAVQKALDSLVEKEKIREKVYGKQKVYFVIQNNDASATELGEKLLGIDREINETTLQLKEVTDKLKTTSAEVAQLTGKLTLGEAINQKVQLENELVEVNKELEKYSDTKEICPKRKLEVEKSHEEILNEYKKRKRMCMDILNSILENYPKTKKHLFEEVGIETDEDAGFSLNKL